MRISKKTKRRKQEYLLMLRIKNVYNSPIFPYIGFWKNRRDVINWVRKFDPRMHIVRLEHL